MQFRFWINEMKKIVLAVTFPLSAARNEMAAFSTFAVIKHLQCESVFSGDFAILLKMSRH